MFGQFLFSEIPSGLYRVPWGFWFPRSPLPVAEHPVPVVVMQGFLRLGTTFGEGPHHRSKSSPGGIRPFSVDEPDAVTASVTDGVCRRDFADLAAVNEIERLPHSRHAAALRAPSGTSGPDYGPIES